MAPAPAWAEARLAVIGALRLARGDAAGLSCFDPTLDGFWRSFRAGVLSYPLYLILLSFPIAGTPPVSGLDGFVIETIHYVVSWVAFPLLVLPLADRLGRGSRFLGFMVVYNWCQLPLTVLFALVALAGGAGLLSPDATSLADLAAAALALVYEWYIARVGLMLDGVRAVLVVVLDILLATVLTQISTALYAG
jgi:hypothetical protein